MTTSQALGAVATAVVVAGYVPLKRNCSRSNCGWCRERGIDRTSTTCWIA
jgi:hypothetical protein